jgi:hypothetical protein
LYFARFQLQAQKRHVPRLDLIARPEGTTHDMFDAGFGNCKGKIMAVIE